MDPRAPHGSPRGLCLDIRPVVVVERDPAIASLLQTLIGRDGTPVHRTRQGVSALQVVTATSVRGVVVALGLPDMDGLSLVATMRLNGVSAPILVVSGRGAPRDEIRALEAGADDYIAKPFDIGVFAARMTTAFGRRETGGHVQELRAGTLVVKHLSRTVTVHGHPLKLRPVTIALLSYFITHAGTILTLKELARDVWGHQALLATNTYRTSISELRNVLRRHAPHLDILTVRGHGYVLRTDVALADPPHAKHGPGKETFI
jgi:DNA-binding response OmpR family regulator